MKLYLKHKTKQKTHNIFFLKYRNQKETNISIDFLKKNIIFMINC